MARIYRRPDEPGGTYYIDYSRNGKRLRRSLETTMLREAKQRRDLVLGDKVNSTWGNKTGDISIDSFWNQYREWAVMYKAEATVKAEESHWKSFVDFARPTTLGSIEARHVVSYIRHRKKQGRSPTTINDTLTCLKSLYNRARELKLYEGGNPLDDVKRLPVETKPARFLSQAQIAAVMEAAAAHSPAIYRFIALGVYSGLRTREIVNARWEWFDFEQGTLTVQKAEDGSFGTKGKRYRSIPLHDKLRTILEPLSREEGYIINGDKTKPGKWRIRYEPKRAFKTVMKAAGVEWCTPHTLRHTFASQLVQAGVSLYKVSKWLGHADITTTQIYAHLAPVDEDINSF